MKFATRIMRILENQARRRTLEQLSSMSDRQLRDCGISRELLSDGVKAWPWRESLDEQEPIRLIKKPLPEVARSGTDKKLDEKPPVEKEEEFAYRRTAA